MHFNKIILALAAAGFASGAYATNGMNMEGYGPIATGMGGASMAYDNGAAAMMNNPATLGLMADGSRLDVAIGFLGPDVSGSCPAAVCGVDASATSGGDAYLMPAFGWVKKSGKMAYGAGVFAQGGMGTEWNANTFLDAWAGVPSRSELGVGRVIFPLAYEASPKLSVGGSFDVVWAGLDMQMAMEGSQFGNMVGAGLITINPGTTLPLVLNPGDVGYFNFSDDNDYTGRARNYGIAGKLGLVYKAAPNLSIGATYHSKTALGDLKGDGTIEAGAAGAGTGTVPVFSGEYKIKDFEWPQMAGLGLSYQATDRLMLAADYKWIDWSDVMKNFNLMFTDSGGAGVFDITMAQNWDDQNVIMLGAAYKATDALTLRVGANLTDNPIPDSTLNPLFPAIVKNHYTLGFGYAFSNVSDLNFSLTYAPEVTQTSGGGVTMDHSQTNWQLMYSHRF